MNLLPGISQAVILHILSKLLIQGSPSQFRFQVIHSSLWKEKNVGKFIGMHNNSIAHNPIFMSHIHSTILYFKSNINLQRQCNQIKSQSGANQRLKSALQHFNIGVSEKSMPLLPLFWRSVNPIPIRGTGYTQHIITAPLQIFRPSAVSEYPHVA